MMGVLKNVKEMVKVLVVFGVCGGINRDGGEEDDVRELEML